MAGSESHGCVAVVLQLCADVTGVMRPPVVVKEIFLSYTVKRIVKMHLFLMRMQVGMVPRVQQA